MSKLLRFVAIFIESNNTAVWVSRDASQSVQRSYTLSVASRLILHALALTLLLICLTTASAQFSPNNSASRLSDLCRERARARIAVGFPTRN